MKTLEKADLLARLEQIERDEIEIIVDEPHLIVENGESLGVVFVPPEIYEEYMRLREQYGKPEA